ncbi:uncharacterized protein CTHT_0022000 [Thermochaetoides thermophila DSM 1495]|uniref:DUF7923 domain-containing protein n=1 Tax=Chaetomium thermophilum (strain DSM 1495 / CBS 144.50 / IMI 039719) TaxID=759272 RepID=G0S3Z7_CHATD|nr:hypothetical protein CTHT_0022000 [Thermochaetoides thermophila DSM 1495]EGS20373.1 hypothetical protein CTHT_0022000 [Thermochaetoides thermophila DSM 1495]
MNSNGYDGYDRQYSELEGLDPSYITTYQAWGKAATELYRLENEMAQKYEELVRKYSEKCAECEREKRTAMVWEKEQRMTLKELQTLKASIESTSFAFVVIDGDGAVFREDLIAKGEEGGGEAAHILNKQLKEYFQQHPQFSGIDTIFVQVVLSVEGLSRALHASGTLPISDYAALTKFGRGFCRAQPLFSFIDVGYGKEQADHKVRKVFEVMEKNVQCKCLILGGCHDNGYATFLESFRGNDKICLLETTPPASDFWKFTFNRVYFPEVFRSEPLPSKQTIPSGFSSTASLAPHHSSSTSSSSSLNSPALTGSPKPSVATQVVSASKSEAQPSSWAAVTKRTSAQRAFMQLNKDDQRVDVPLPKADYNAVKSLDERSKINGANFCNHTYH